MGDNTPRPISIEQIVAFLAAKKAHVNCPHCGTDRWLVNDPHSFVIPVLNTDGSIQLGTGVHILAVLCANCAYVWPMSRLAIVEWLNDQDSQNGRQ